MPRKSIAAVVFLAGCGADPEPVLEPVALHRLNRAEYDRTVRDLLDTTRAPAADFPSDDTSHGFDNIADVLALSPLQLELYRAAAKDLVEEISGKPQIARVEGFTLSGPHGAAFHESGWRLAEGFVTIPFSPPAPGKYRISGALLFLPLGDETPRAIVELNGGSLIETSAARFEVETTLSSTGAVSLLVRMANPFRQGAAARSIVLDWMAIEGPLDDVSVNERIFSCRSSGPDISACAGQILRPFLRRAYRRPITEEELARLVSLAQLAFGEGERFEDAIGAALEAALISPHFLFRVEKADARGRLDDHALASRLSYFLWSSMPDDRLFDLAERGALQDDVVLAEEVSRMLDDPKADALQHNFAGQWLQTRGLATAMPDGTLFPEFDDSLRDALAAEMNLFFAAILAEGTPEDLLLAPYTFADARLAAFYGLPVPAGEGFSRISLDESFLFRRGLLGKGAFQVVSSHPDRTSPVRRGKWVLKELLCAEPPPPPPGVAQLPKDPAVQGSLRARLEEHRKNPACASCHATMDPIGFGLENFDPIGRWRTEDNGETIDSSGRLPDGTSFDGPRALSEIIAAKPELRRCIVEKLFTYALGRAPSPEDELAAIGGEKLRDLIRSLVLSESFRGKKVSR